MKLILAIPAAGLLFSGAISLDKVSQTYSGLKPVKSEAVSAAETTPKMWVDNSKVFKGETLKLHFSTPHGPYLGVIDPEGNFFYVVFPADQSAGNLKPLVSSEQFVALEALTINTSAFKADPYTEGILDNKPVFTKSGQYRFLLGENLHTDDARFVDVVKVYYKHKYRPAREVVAYAAR
ncbi:MAG: hypothetical protein KA165_00195 [Saprospiraceae bacterium]|nr:hypothetical protein [Saprospiraceae bacterium]